MPSEFNDITVHARTTGQDVKSAATEHGAAQYSATEHLGEMLKETLSCKTYVGCAETVAMGTVAAALAARYALPLIGIGLKDAAVSEEHTGLAVITKKVASEVPNLSSGESLRPGFRYFQQSDGAAPYNLYRMPANGLPIEQQPVASVQKYVGTASWQNGHRETLIKEMLKGWFDEKQDALSEAQAGRLAAKIDKP